MVNLCRNKTLRKIIVICIFLFICIFFVFLHVVKKQNQNVQGDDYAVGTNIYISMGRNGILFYNELMMFADAQSTQQVVICNKPDCRHIPCSSIKPEADCDADFTEIPEGFAYYNNQLYYLCYSEDYGILGKDLYIADLNGASRRKIATMEDMEVLEEVLYQSGNAFITYYNQTDTVDKETGDMTKLEKKKAGVAIVRLSDGMVTRLPMKEEYGAGINGVSVIENTVYYAVSYLGEEIDFDIDYTDEEAQQKLYDSIMENVYISLFYYNLQTGEEKCIDTFRELDGMACAGNKLYYGSRNDDGYSLIMYNEKTEEKETILTSDTTISVLQDGDLLHVVTLMEENEQIVYRYYDEKDTYITIGERAADYFYSAEMILDNIVYIFHYDDMMELTYGYLTKSDFMSGNFDRITDLYWPNRN